MRPALLLSLLWLACLVIAPAWAAPTPSEPGRASVYTTWNTSALYLAVKVTDRMVVGNQTAPLSQPWLDDAVAVYLDLDPTDGDALNDRCVRVVISGAGGATVQRGDNGVWRDDPAWFQLSRQGIIRYAVTVDGKLNDQSEPDHGYLVEMGLAWGLLGALPPVREHATDPLPTIGFAAAVYAQGETQAVSCWPTTLDADALRHPLRWGKLQFTQTTQPSPPPPMAASATLTRGDIVVDGNIGGLEWLMAGVTTFPLAEGTAAVPLEPERQTVSVIAAWYLLDPSPRGTHQPLEPISTAGGPDTAYYHLRQLYDVRRAGIDALVVSLPSDLPRERVRTNLSALVTALSVYDRANAAAFFTDTPLLVPAVELRRGADPRAAEWLLDDFYRLVPPQYRLMLDDATGKYRYPVLWVASGALPAGYPYLTELGAALRQKLGRPVGWLLDNAWAGAEVKDDVLARCAWDPMAGVQLGQGPLRVAMITPGMDAGPDRTLPRRGGATYDNGWLKVTTARPELLLIRGWNDFANGTEIAPSRQDGTDFRDRTRLAVIALQEGRKFGLTALRQDVPAIIPAGQTRRFELLLKNAGTGKMLGNEGCRVDFRLERDGRTVLRGPATERLALLELSAARLGFDFAATDGKKALPAGDYTLSLDFRRNKIAQVEIPGLSEKLWTLTLPLTIGPGGTQPSLAGCELPALALPGEPLPVALTVRLPDTLHRKEPLSLRIRWATDKGTMLAALSQLNLPDQAEPGALVTLTGTTPPAPGNPGWYQAQVEWGRGSEAPVRLTQRLVKVVESDLRAQLLEIALPGRIADAKTVEVPVTLRNAGKTAWPATDTLLTYQWQRLDGRPLPGAAGTVPLTQKVNAGRAVSLWPLIPVPAGIGPVRCAFGLVSAGQTVKLDLSPLQRAGNDRVTVLRPERYQFLDLSAAVSVRTINGLTAKESAAQMDPPTPRGGLDGAGNLFPLEEFLPDGSKSPDGYPACYGLDADTPAGLPPIQFLPATNGRAPLVRARGQVLALPDVAGTALYLAATSAGADLTTTVTVRYADGTEQAIPLQVSPWLGAPRHGEPVMLRTHTLRTARGDDNTQSAAVYLYRLPLDQARIPAALLLPDQFDLCLFGATVVKEQ